MSLRVGAASLRHGLIEARRWWISHSVLAPWETQYNAAWDRARTLPGWFTDDRSRAMFAAMVESPPRVIVEIGSYMGKSTIFLADAARRLGNLERLVAIDPHTGDRNQLEAIGAATVPSLEMFRTHVAASGHDDVIEPVVATSMEASAAWDGTAIDLLFIDGWHSYDAVREDGAAWVPRLSPHGVVVFDDVAQEEIMRAARDLAATGLFTLWGAAFGQAFGGAQPEAPEPLRRLLAKTAAGWSRRLGA